VLNVPEEPIWMTGDPTRLAQSIGNLLQNAAKFTDPGGRVTIRVTVDADHRRATVAVTDTGIGIDPEMLSQMFEAFSQADRTLDRSRGGLGLGLALAKGLVELHGGQVRAESEGPGRGTTVTLLLPLTPSTATPEAPPPAAASTVDLRVLVVEDIHDAAEMFKELLETVGCTVQVAYNGRTAVELARQFRPEVVLCDLGLPEMDGYQVARALRQDPATPTPRLIAVTGYGQEKDERRSRAAGFDLHLTKPINFEALQRLLAVPPESRQS
jgi:CheY-like chemotaxis protein